MTCRFSQKLTNTKIRFFTILLVALGFKVVFFKCDETIACCSAAPSLVYSFGGCVIYSLNRRLKGIHWFSLFWHSMLARFSFFPPFLNAIIRSDIDIIFFIIRHIFIYGFKVVLFLRNVKKIDDTFEFLLMYFSAYRSKLC